MAAILSAQATDRRVNEVTRELFARYRSAADYAAADVTERQALIRPTGFFRAKAGTLIRLGQALCDRFGGRVPDTLEELVSLPGVGRKTASVVLGDAFGKPSLTVDTHVAPAGPPAWLDGAHRPGQDRAGRLRPPAAPGVDCGLAPADLARPPGRPCTPARVRRLPDRWAVPLVRCRADR